MIPYILLSNLITRLSITTESNPLDSTRLCLLSLNSGGVRGLLTLYILKSIIDQLNNKRKTINLLPIKPCEVFDFISSTSTSGLITIILSRLEINVDKCIKVYTKLAEAVKAQFDSLKLEKAIRETIKGSSISKIALFNDGNERECRTYALSDELNILASICQATLATSATTTFFEPVRIKNRQFADSGLGANNLVDEVEGEAPLVKCFILIRTSNLSIKAFEESFIKFLSQTVISITTEIEETKKRFIAKWRKYYNENRYFRFNYK
ncbi:phospholipase, patatin family protein [Leptodontidium sp. MPI-SDFR-AT-0119]|nr:phospholipase, patatin family protein [Leptodontidium sp. MPI-SDFR-AT-0119]